MIDQADGGLVEAKRTTRVNSVTITPQCRSGQGDQGAWDEAVPPGGVTPTWGRPRRTVGPFVEVLPQ